VEQIVGTIVAEVKVKLNDFTKWADHAPGLKQAMNARLAFTVIEASIRLYANASADYNSRGLFESIQQIGNQFALPAPMS
jgi:hypothetical protein